MHRSFAIADPGPVISFDAIAYSYKFNSRSARSVAWYADRSAMR